MQYFGLTEQHSKLSEDYSWFPSSVSLALSMNTFTAVCIYIHNSVNKIIT